MRRAWPFENTPEGGKRSLTNTYRTPDDFLRAHPEGSEAVVVRIGLHDAQLVLVDAEGAWDRWVYPSVDEATASAGKLGVPVHVGEYPESLRVRMNSHRRPPRSFAAGAYPEQGSVGPVIPYPENRPRRLEERDGGKDAREAKDAESS
jgi:hypothetical protein